MHISLLDTALHVLRVTQEPPSPILFLTRPYIYYGLRRPMARALGAPEWGPEKVLLPQKIKPGHLNVQAVTEAHIKAASNL